MSSKTKTKLGNGLYRETKRYNNGSGHSVVYKQGLFLRDVKSRTSFKK